MIRLLIVTVFFGSCLHAQINRNDSLAAYYSIKMKKYLDRDAALFPYYRIDANGVSVFADTAVVKVNRNDTVSSVKSPEYFVAWNELETYQNMMHAVRKDSAMKIMLDKGAGPFPQWVISEYGGQHKPAKKPEVLDMPFAGFRIAIDPGHTAGDTAEGRTEEKFIRFRVKSVPPGLDTSLYHVEHVGDSVDIHLVEGMLTWQVGSVLAERLRSAGATVLLTRNGPGMTAFGKTFEQWKQQDYQRTLDSLLKIDPADKNLLKLKKGIRSDDRFIFRYVFRDAELRKRAELINAFHPDLTVIIHFNVDEKNKDWLKPTDKDFCMAFVGGSFQKGELSDSERRFDFLRLLLTTDLNESIAASQQATDAFSRTLNVPLAKTGDATYLQEHCIYSGRPGVFLRNLSLTRLVSGTVIYGETLYQDNVLECLELSASGSQVVYGATIPSRPRLDAVEQAYELAIINWAATQH